VGIAVDRFDHIVVNCKDVEATASWYERVLGMRRETFGSSNRTALRFGGQKINLRPVGALADDPD
jgi:catechol 2,3-dioxygenase-like lactoylglutathione lyase family enzyme